LLNFALNRFPKEAKYRWLAVNYPDQVKDEKGISPAETKEC
jgi:hypothetical protein